MNGNSIPHTLRDVLHVPDATNCLISVSRHDAVGGIVEFCDRGCTLRHKDRKIVGKGTLKNKSYLLFVNVNKTNTTLQGLGMQEQTNQSRDDKATWEEWHKHYGHISVTAIQQLSQRDMVTGFSVDTSSSVSYDCLACIQAKQARRPFPKEAQN
jgi:GAG-pre-integrase domain